MTEKKILDWKCRLPKGCLECPNAINGIPAYPQSFCLMYAKGYNAGKEDRLGQEIQKGTRKPCRLCKGLFLCMIDDLRAKVTGSQRDILEQLKDKVRKS